jgi:hypothetical protein
MCVSWHQTLVDHRTSPDVVYKPLVQAFGCFDRMTMDPSVLHGTSQWQWCVCIGPKSSHVHLAYRRKCTTLTSSCYWRLTMDSEAMRTYATRSKSTPCASGMCSGVAVCRTMLHHVEHHERIDVDVFQCGDAVGTLLRIKIRWMDE